MIMQVLSLFENRIKRFKTEYDKLSSYINEAVSLQEEIKLVIENKLAELDALNNDTEMEINAKYVMQNSMVAEIEKNTKTIFDISEKCKQESEKFSTSVETLIDEMYKQYKNSHKREDISRSVYKKITDN